jgi:hypothetical protein
MHLPFPFRRESAFNISCEVRHHLEGGFPVDPEEYHSKKPEEEDP